MEKIYETPDLSLAGFLVAKGYIYTVRKEGKKGIFIFETDDEFENIINDYYSNGSVNVLDYKDALRNLKSRIINS